MLPYINLRELLSKSSIDRGSRLMAEQRSSMLALQRGLQSMNVRILPYAAFLNSQLLLAK